MDAELQEAIRRFPRHVPHLQNPDAVYTTRRRGNYRFPVLDPDATLKKLGIPKARIMEGGWKHGSLQHAIHKSFIAQERRRYFAKAD